MKPSSRLLRRCAVFAASIFASALFASFASADVELEGDWSSSDKRVTLDVTGAPRSRAIELLAQAAGFSVVMSSPLQDNVDVHVKDQPASQVLGLLLPSGNYVAKRTGNLVSIHLAAPPPVPITVANPPANAEPGEDRDVFGGSLTLGKGETAHDVAVYGGSADIYGTVTGDLAVLGGSVHVHDGAKVLGEPSILGGSMQVDEGAEVPHEASVIGGHLDRRGKRNRRDNGKVVDLNSDERSVSKGAKLRSALSAWGEGALSSLSLAATLFVFGTVVVALASDKSRLLRVEAAARPMRTLALGVVGCLGAAVVGLALCVTLIGIPVALVASGVFVLVAYVGVTAILTTVGEALLRHKTENAYVHLAVGCGLYFLVGLMPWVGKWSAVLVFLAGVGVMVATRLAGLFPEKHRVGYDHGYPR